MGDVGGCLGWGKGVIMNDSASGDTAESLYAVRPECLDDVPVSRFKPRRGKTLSARKWISAFSQDGHLDIAKVISRIQRGGVHPSIKAVVWEFLLSCYDPNSTFDERSQLREQRREQYAAWKTECQSIEPTVGSGKYLTMPIISEDGQPIQDLSVQVADIKESNLFVDTPVSDASSEKNILKWKLTLHQIGLDVVRTDRALAFYENDANLAKLWDVLVIYAWVDEDIGYCQGMSDLCSPIVILLENEADAFWCFERVMRRLRGNFKSTANSIGVQSQLSTLGAIIRTVDPRLHQHLEDMDGGQYLFAFRMLMVLFRREFSFVDAMYLWELMWAMEYNPNMFSYYESSSTNISKDVVPSTEDDKQLKKYGKFERKNVRTGGTDQQTSLSVFIVAGVLEAKNKRLLKEASGMDDVIKILNDITGNLDAKKACKEALEVHKKYLSKTRKS
ncbi:hypothetical protein GIB67_031306 [Kingdonia uniflora]|uniref:Rab-GAP TBC domain-containing protein n=1 Tax=Kingdonia uniflora TaxID=39325 RepID=A0A7J7P677_9MAGN|nr:hypothetical protein GIB67_031306 [Kingdonia uniflora]